MKDLTKRFPNNSIKSLENAVGCIAPKEGKQLSFLRARDYKCLAEFKCPFIIDGFTPECRYAYENKIGDGPYSV